jgi:hypothetical protein
MDAWISERAYSPKPALASMIDGPASKLGQLVVH